MCAIGLPPGTYQVCYSSILVCTAALSRLLLKRQHSSLQWLAIIVVTLGLVLSGMAPQTAHGHVKVPAARVLMSERHPMHVASSAQASSPDHHAAIAVTAAGTALQQSASGLGSDTDITAVVSSSSVLDAINNDLHSTEHATYVGESAAAWVGVALTLATAFLYACQYVLYDHLLHSKPKAAPAAAPASAGLQIIKGGASADQQAGASMLQRDSPGHGHSTSCLLYTSPSPRD